ncbi:unnamed protein product [Tilletia controversa]|nr:unnamed protein product [Tilletia controversa]
MKMEMARIRPQPSEPREYMEIAEQLDQTLRAAERADRFQSSDRQRTGYPDRARGNGVNPRPPNIRSPQLHAIQGQSVTGSDQEDEAYETASVGAATDDGEEHLAALSPDQLKCYQCQKMGHIARHCPDRASKADKGSSEAAETVEDEQIAALLMRLENKGPSSGPEDGPVRLDAWIGAHQVRTLLDTGATDNFVSSTLAKRCNLSITSSLRSPRGVGLPDGRSIASPGGVEFSMACGEFKSSLTARVIDMTGGYPTGTRVIISHQGMSTVIGMLVLHSTRLRPRRIHVSTSGNESDPTRYQTGTRRPGTHFSLPPGEVPASMPKPRVLTEPIIDTGSSKPVNVRAYGLTASQQQEQTKQIEMLLDRGLVRESSSPWGFPVLFVPKKDGGWRMCVDYRSLNQLTVKNGYPCFSKIDLVSGYWQIRLAAADVQKTAFNTRQGKYEYLAMPFGLSNAPSVFQTIVNNVMRPFLDKFVIVYLDDILIFSRSPEEHRQHVKLVLEALQTAGLYANPKKSFFARREMEFCGHLVSQGRVKPLEDKLKVIKTWPAPKTVHDVRAFMGLVNYYRRYARNFASVSAPITDLLKHSVTAPTARRKPTKQVASTGADPLIPSTPKLPSTLKPFKLSKNAPVQWTVQCQEAFEKLKDLLCSAPALRQPDTSKPFRVETDASDWAIGCVLMQEDTQRVMHPVAFDGRKLNAAELNYPVHEKELLGVRYALQVWRQYIDNGLKVTVVTDHESLKYLPTTKIASKRLARWVADFGEYPLDLVYRRGEENVIADAISRRPDFLAALGYPASFVAALDEEPEEIPFLRDYLVSGVLPLVVPGRTLDRVREEATHYRVDDNGTLLRVLGDNRLAPYVEPIHRVYLMSKLHEGQSHLGAAGLWGLLESRGWWPGMKSDLRRFCASCGVCQVSARPQPDQEREYAVVVADTTIQPFERWGVDLIGKLPSTPDGNRWIVTAVDYATGWPLARALPDAKAERIAEFIHNEVFMNFGAPRDFITDNGENLLAEVVEALMRGMNSRHRLATAYHPRTNGRVESLNGTLGKTLTKLLVGQQTRLWDRYLPQALFACRVRTHASTGYSPFQLVYGVEPRLPGEHTGSRVVSGETTDVIERLPRLRSAREQARERSHARALKNKSQRDERVRPHTLAVGSLVLVRNENATKFEAKWFGPYRITALKELGTYALETVNGNAVRALLHGNRLRAAQATGQLEWWHNPDHRGRVNLGDVGAVEVPTTAVNERLQSQVDAEYDRVPEMRGRPRRRGPSASPDGDPPPPVARQ